MKYYIDQSGKIEDTNKTTVVAYANSHCYAVVIKGKEKRLLQKVYRDAGKIRVFIYQTFAALSYLLIESHLDKHPMFIIDREYPGHEDTIKNYLLQLSRYHKGVFLPKGNIHFEEIGKSSPAHDFAWKTYKGKIIQPVKNVTAEDILTLVISLT